VLLPNGTCAEAIRVDERKARKMAKGKRQFRTCPASLFISVGESRARREIAQSVISYCARGCITVNPSSIPVTSDEPAPKRGSSLLLLVRGRLKGSGRPLRQAFKGKEERMRRTRAAAGKREAGDGARAELDAWLIRYGTACIGVSRRSLKALYLYEKNVYMYVRRCALA